MLFEDKVSGNIVVVSDDDLVRQYKSDCRYKRFDGDFNEDDHPRDENGKFSKSSSSEKQWKDMNEQERKEHTQILKQRRNENMSPEKKEMFAQRKREADKAYREKNREKQKAYLKEYYQKNKEKYSESSKNRYEENKESIKAHRKEYYEKNKESSLEKNKEYRQKNKEKIQKIVKEYAKNNPDITKKAKDKWKELNKDKPEYKAKTLARARRRQNAKIQRSVAWADPVQIAEKFMEAARLTKETGIPHHVDHIFPLRGKTVSGLDTPNNLQVIPAKENLSKNNKFLGYDYTPEEIMEANRRLREWANKK